MRIRPSGRIYMKKILTVFTVVGVVMCTLFSFAGCNKKYNYYEVPEKTYAEGEEFLEGCGNYNNGYDKESEEVDRLISVLPSEKQLDYLELEYYNFIHFGMNTMTGKEWGTGKESPSDFNPEKLDTDQWCEVLKASGSKGVILTAKHHDGFCLWQTKTTKHSIAYSPYKDGKGDIVKELSESCKKYGLKFGIYLSPWDMNAECYGTNEYNDFYKAQLRELLCGDYGEIFCVWMDGALGKEAELDPDFEYDMEGYEQLINDLQPGCVTAIKGSDVRWVGNEAGIARESEWSVVSMSNAASEHFQTSEGDAANLQTVSDEAEDRGSRELLENYKDLAFYPAEVDVSIRKGWFYHWYQSPKSLDQLLQIYFTSVGGNSSLLLNIPPNKDGLIADKDVKALKEFGEAIAATTANKLNVSKIEVGDNDAMTEKQELYNLLDNERDGYTFASSEYILDFYLEEPSSLYRIDLREDLRSSQRVEQFEVWVRSQGKWKLIGDSTVIGNRRILVFENAPESDVVRIVVKQSRSVPVLRSVELYAR